MPTFVISSPCIKPSAIAIRIIEKTAAAAGQRQSVNIIDSRTPSSANTEPTERSMPPVMMTTPRPILNMPYVPTSRAMFCRFAAPRNRGLIAATTRHKTTNSMKIPSSFFIVMYGAARLTSTLALSRAAPDGEPHDGLFATLFALKNACDAAFVHDGHAVAYSEYLFHITADHDYGHAPAC